MIKEKNILNAANWDDNYLRDFFEHAPVGFHVFGSDRKIIDINQTELDMIGYERKEIVQVREWSQLIVEGQRPQFEKHWEALNAKKEVTNYHYTLLRKDGRPIEVLLNASARFDPQGRLVNTRGIVFDITQEYRQLAFVSSRPGMDLIEQKKLLEQKNLALNQLLVRIELERVHVIENVHHNVRELILPLVQKLKRKGSPLDRRYLDLLEKGLLSITGGFSSTMNRAPVKLSGREKEICHMIKEGHNSKAIADLLNTSLRTVENHRNRIRKKLGISKREVDLAAHLRSLDAV
jgi:PAS domain S-box-containing protein